MESTTYTIRMPSVLKEELEGRAKKRGLKLGPYLVKILEGGDAYLSAEYMKDAYTVWMEARMHNVRTHSEKQSRLMRLAHE